MKINSFNVIINHIIFKNNNLKNKQKLTRKAGLFLSLILFISIFLVVLNIYVKPSIGGVADRLVGYAWSENVGWVSFNCTNNLSCATADYGVDIDPATLNLSGYAWSSNVGWISFEESDAPPDAYAFNSNCSAVCDSFTSCTACYDQANGNVWGWAKILSLGDDGWLRLHSTGTPPVYDGVSLDQTTGDFNGWAWNGNGDGSGVGWISFNCLDTASCGVSDYKVGLSSFNFPQPIDLSAPNWGTANACAVDARHAFLDWSFYDNDMGAYQSAYHVIISTDNSSTTGVVYDTGKVLSGATQYYISTSTLLNFDTPYYWFVSVWDDFGFNSGWYQFDTINGTSSHVLTDNVARNSAVSPNPSLTFTTYLHEFPDIIFSYLPTDPVKGDPVSFTDVSEMYFTGAPSVPVLCTNIDCVWAWSASGLESISSPTASNTSMLFSYGTQTVTSQVVDVDGYVCSSTQMIDIDVYPDWREVRPD